MIAASLCSRPRGRWLDDWRRDSDLMMSCCCTSTTSSSVGRHCKIDSAVVHLSVATPSSRGRFTSAHYKSVHHHLFRDVYTWAGKHRTVHTAKGGNWFCYPEHIASSMDQLFKKLEHPASSVSRGERQIAVGLYASSQSPCRPPAQLYAKTFMPAIITSFLGDNGSLRTELQKLLRPAATRCRPAGLADDERLSQLPSTA